MKLTLHGEDRIALRSTMPSQDIIDLIEAGAVVSLGSTDTFEHLLCYMESDDCCKIACVSPTRSAFLSLWEETWEPKGACRVTEDLLIEAKQRWLSYVIQNRPAPIVVLKVCEGNIVSYATTLGHLARDTAQSVILIAAHFASRLHEVWSVVEGHLPLAVAPVHYQFAVVSELKVDELCISHENLEKFLKPA